MTSAVLSACTIISCTILYQIKGGKRACQTLPSILAAQY